MAQQSSTTREYNKQVKELIPSRPVQPNETIVIDDDDDMEISGPSNISSAVDISSEHAKQTDKPVVEVINLDDKNNVPDKKQDTNKATKVSRRIRPRPPELPKKKHHKTIRIALTKTSTSNISIKSFKPTISLQKLFAGTSPRLIVKDNELQPAVALTEQYNTLPRQHPVHNWTIGFKRHKFRIYTK